MSPHHPNAPKVFGGAISIGSPSAAFSAGVVGSQNARLPLFMSTTPNGTPIALPEVSTLSDMSRSDTIWQVVFSGHKTIFTSEGGLTIGLSGDVYVPVGPQSPTATPVLPLISSRAARAGITFGF